ncbi:MAG: hypothetical protein VW443_04800 [Pseudomonadales bacterium]|jgi:hypothetical protein
MKTNDLKKGARVILRNGWHARLEDNRKGNTRVATVYGDYTEMGSVYSHDIVGYETSEGFIRSVEHTPKQEALRAQLVAGGWGI